MSFHFSWNLWKDKELKWSGTFIEALPLLVCSRCSVRVPQNGSSVLEQRWRRQPRQKAFHNRSVLLTRACAISPQGDDEKHYEWCVTRNGPLSDLLHTALRTTFTIVGWVSSMEERTRIDGWTLEKEGQRMRRPEVGLKTNSIPSKMNYSVSNWWAIVDLRKPKKYTHTK